MMRSFNLRTRCATASRRASGEAALPRLCVERAPVPVARDRLCVLLPLARVPRDAVEPRGDDAPPVERREPPVRADELDADLEPALREPPLREPPLPEPVFFEPPLPEPLLLEPPLPEPLLLGWGNFSSFG